MTDKDRVPEDKMGVGVSGGNHWPVLTTQRFRPFISLTHPVFVNLRNHFVDHNSIQFHFGGQMSYCYSLEVVDEQQHKLGDQNTAKRLI